MLHGARPLSLTNRPCMWWHVRRNATIYLKGQDISYNEAIKTAEEVTGKKMEITHVSREEIDKESAGG